MASETTVFIPGLGDRMRPFSWAAKIWPTKAHVFESRWSTDESFDDKLLRLLKVVDNTAARKSTSSPQAQDAA